jgi:TRAP-type mannitol/chloroaromatic compound transport system permease small subunit
MASWQRQAERLKPIIAVLDWPALWVGKAAAWLIVPLVGVLVYEVFMRYVLGSPTIWAYDLTYMFYGSIFMLGSAYALGRDAHVRADFIYQHLSPRGQAVIDGFFYLVFFFPAIGIFTWLTAGEAIDSWRMGERIPSSPWMPIIYPYKAVMPLTGALLLIQGSAELLKNVYSIVTNNYFREPPEQPQHLAE